MITLTSKMVNDMRTDGGSYTTATIKALGFEWKDLKSGWPSAIVGLQVTQEQYDAAIAGRSIFVSGPNRVRTHKETVRDKSIRFLDEHGFNASCVTTVRIANIVNALVFGIFGSRISKAKCLKFLEDCIEAGLFEQKWNVRTPQECWEKTEKPKSPSPTVRVPEPKIPPRPRIDPQYSREKYASFLESQEWRELRVMVLLHHGRKCCLCGESEVVIQVDHIVPASVDWSRRMDFNNLQVLCKPCNLGKSNRYSEDWRR